MEASRIGPQERTHQPGDIAPVAGTPLSGSLSGRKAKTAETSEIEKMKNFRNITGTEAGNILASTDIKHDYVVRPSSDGGYAITVKTKDQGIISIRIPRNATPDFVKMKVAIAQHDPKLLPKTKHAAEEDIPDFEKMKNFMNLDGEGANALLATGKGIPHNYLIRPSSGGGYTLSLKTKEGNIEHMRLSKEHENEDALMTYIAKRLGDAKLFAQTKAGQERVAERAAFAGSQPEDYAIKLAEQFKEEIDNSNVDFIINSSIRIEKELVYKNISDKGALHLAAAIKNALWSPGHLPSVNYSKRELEARQHAADLANKLVESAGFDSKAIDIYKIELMSTKEFAGRMPSNEAKAFLAGKQPGDWLIRMTHDGDFIATKSMGGSYVSFPVSDYETITNLKKLYDNPRELLMCGHHVGVKKKADAERMLMNMPVGTWLIRCQPKTNNHRLLRKEVDTHGNVVIAEHKLNDIKSLDTVVAQFARSNNPLDISKGLYQEDV